MAVLTDSFDNLNRFDAGKEVREVSAEAIADAVAQLYVTACTSLGPDVIAALELARKSEQSPLGREILSQLLENARLASEQGLPVCQDTGLAVIFIDIGQDVRIVGDLESALSEGVRRACVEGWLRRSVVDDPAGARRNTGDNTPPVVHTRIVPGDRVHICVLPKGAGAENKSALGMLSPSCGRQGVVDFVVDVVSRGGASACPPLVVGVGVGGNFEKAPLLAKSALLRPLGSRAASLELSALEDEIEQRCNALGIGPMGLGGTVTVLDVFVEQAPCHIASLPVAVNLQCHAQRHAEIWL